MKDYLIFGKPDLRESDIQEVLETLRSGWIGTGPRVARFEAQFRDYVGTRNAIAVSSCTAALHISLVASGIGPGDEVITTPLTFAATANAVIHAGAMPHFVDVDRQTQNIDPQKLRTFLETECVAERKTGVPLNQRTHRRVRALLPVHLAGRPCEMDALRDIADEYRLVLIEDAAHAVGARWREQSAGAIGDLGCFSFYVTKNVMTGEGGMITTDDDELAARLKIYALHGLSADAWKRFSDQGFKHYEVVVPGFKANMTDLQAALGIHQLARIEEMQTRREEVWARYDEALTDTGLGLPAAPAEGTRHARHLYTVMADAAACGTSRDDLQQKLHERGIGTGVHYRAVHLHEYYRREFGYARGNYPAAEWISDRTLSLPLSSWLTDDDVERVIKAVREILGR